MGPVDRPSERERVPLAGSKPLPPATPDPAPRGRGRYAIQRATPHGSPAAAGDVIGARRAAPRSRPVAHTAPGFPRPACAGASPQDGGGWSWPSAQGGLGPAPGAPAPAGPGTVRSSPALPQEGRRALRSVPGDAEELGGGADAAPGWSPVAPGPAAFGAPTSRWGAPGVRPEPRPAGPALPLPCGSRSAPRPGPPPRALGPEVRSAPRPGQPLGGCGRGRDPPVCAEPREAPHARSAFVFLLWFGPHPNSGSGLTPGSHSWVCPGGPSGVPEVEPRFGARKANASTLVLSVPRPVF